MRASENEDATTRQRGNVPVRPFPWTSLDSLARGDGTRLHQVRRVIASWIDANAFRRHVEEVAHAEISVRLRTFGPARPGDPSAVGVKLAVADGAGVESELAVLEAEAALVSAIVGGALSRSSARRAVVPGRSASPDLAAAFAAVIATALRRSAAPSPASSKGPVRVRAFGSARSSDVSPLGDPLRAESTWRALSFTVRIGDEAFVARLLLPRAASEQAAPIAFDAAKLRALGEVPLAVPVVAAVVQSSARELAALAVGDAFVPDRSAWTLSIGRPGAAWSGPVWLVGADADAGRQADLTADGTLVVRTGDTSLAWTPGTTDGDDGESGMNANDSDNDGAATTGALLAALGDAPLVVRVEVGVAEMRAREWAALSPGDVVALGRRIGEPVVLRVAGREVARGELVDLEGEIGVRIMSRSEEP